MSFAITAFCTIAFKLYTRSTDINLIFNLNSLNLKGLRYVWVYIYWGLIGLPFLTLLVMACQGRRKKFREANRFVYLSFYSSNKKSSSPFSLSITFFFLNSSIFQNIGDTPTYIEH